MSREPVSVKAVVPVVVVPGVLTTLGPGVARIEALPRNNSSNSIKWHVKAVFGAQTLRLLFTKLNASFQLQPTRERRNDDNGNSKAAIYNKN